MIGRVATTTTKKKEKRKIEWIFSTKTNNKTRIQSSKNITTSSVINY